MKLSTIKKEQFCHKCNKEMALVCAKTKTAVFKCKCGGVKVVHKRENLQKEKAI